ncbi:hypothetical protein SLE2022_334540 [Rubroshorea leprosula]
MYTRSFSDNRSNQHFFCAHLFTKSSEFPQLSLKVQIRIADIKSNLWIVSLSKSLKEFPISHVMGHWMCAFDWFISYRFKISCFIDEIAFCGRKKVSR